MAKDDKDLEGDEEPTAGGGKKKLIIIIGAAVLLLLIGVGAALLLLGGDEEVAEGDEAAAEAVEPVELADPIYYQFKPQFVVSLPPGGRARMLQVSLQVMSRQQEVIDYITRNDPMLRHHLFNLFSGQDAEALYSREGREALAAEVREKLVSLVKPKVDALLKEQEQDVQADIEAVYFSELVLQ